MDANYNNPFAPEPPRGLLKKIMRQIRAERRLITIKRRITIFFFFFFGSAAALFSSFRFVRAGFAETGFFRFFSLIFSDADIIFAYWQSFALSLLETIPVTSLMLFSLAVLVFLMSLKLLSKNIKVVLNQTQLINN